jgi:hypothetical protein
MFKDKFMPLQSSHHASQTWAKAHYRAINLGNFMMCIKYALAKCVTFNFGFHFGV